ncbi:hypothetical protein SAY87_000539 [Trapa incisa]|uniref:Uncharacterized protein n=1 Tax=Trapa incisa TaxID=236973 RepID=A0AAN7JH79_9MYRT|nr:hypothetical protein SAY87_000539 [Trapa incisa]
MALDGPIPNSRALYGGYRSSRRSSGRHETQLQSEHEQCYGGLRFTRATPTSINQRGTNRSLGKILGPAPVTVQDIVGLEDYLAHAEPAIGNATQCIGPCGTRMLLSHTCLDPALMVLMCHSW